MPTVRFDPVHLIRACLLGLLLCGKLPAVDPEFNWREIHSGEEMLWGITRGNAGLVAVGTGGKILVSADGMTWRPTESGTSDWLVDVTFAESRYYAVGDNGCILVSSDARTWTRNSSVPTRQRLNAIRYLGDFLPVTFLAVGEGGTILTSRDGNTWIQVASGTTRWLRGIGGSSSFGWIVVGQGGTMLASNNGTAWRMVGSGTTEDLEAVKYLMGFAASSKGLPFEYGYANLLAVGAGGTEIAISYSYERWGGDPPRLFMPNASQVQRNGGLPKGIRFRQLLFGLNGRVLAVGDDGSVYSSYSLSTEAWTKLDVGTTRTFLGGAGTSQGIYLVGGDGAILRGMMPNASRIRNLAARGVVGQNGLIAGTVVPTGGKRVLVRAIGPALRSFGVAAAIPDPVLTVYDGLGRAVLRSSGSGSGAALAEVQRASVESGAFYIDPNAGDAAAVLTLLPGAWTFNVASLAGSSGEALVEIYDLDRGPTAPSLSNLSIRATASGEQRVTAGFVIDGGTAKTLMVRAVGPGLAAFGVNDAVPDPAVSVFSAPGFGAYQGGNDNWGVRDFSYVETSAAALRATEIGMGAFPLVDGSKDAAVLVSVGPGAYTAMAVQKEGTPAGTVLLELYDVAY